MAREMNRAKWYRDRNQRIFEDHKAGMKPFELSLKYLLCEAYIKLIIREVENGR